MSTQTNFKHAGDDFKQWSKYKKNLSQWYLQWKKCTIQEDMLLTWTTVLRLTSVSLFGFLTYTVSNCSLMLESWFRQNLIFNIQINIPWYFWGSKPMLLNIFILNPPLYSELNLASFLRPYYWSESHNFSKQTSMYIRMW